MCVSVVLMCWYLCTDVLIMAGPYTIVCVSVDFMLVVGISVCV